MNVRANDALGRFRVDTDEVERLRAALRARDEADARRRAEEDAGSGDDDGVRRNSDDLRVQVTLLKAESPSSVDSWKHSAAPAKMMV